MSDENQLRPQVAKSEGKLNRAAYNSEYTFLKRESLEYAHDIYRVLGFRMELVC